MNDELELAKFRMEASHLAVSATMYDLFTIVCLNIKFITDLRDRTNSASIKKEINDHLEEITKRLRADD